MPLLCTHFGFSFEFVLHTLPRPDLWKAVTRLYRFPELAYGHQEKTMVMTLLEFGSSHDDLADKHRLWLAKEFIPLPFPGLSAI